MKVLIKKWIATYADEANFESFENWNCPIPKTIKDDDGKPLVGNTYDEILSFVNDDIDYWRMNRPVSENHGFEQNGNVITVWDDYGTVNYTMEQIEIEIEVDVK